ncbi:MAG: phosphate ABC transporter permease subunit PstC [Paracoccaceae bacterium]|jgi:phosphate transport system permease protein|uniref:phosphate ABC transporter permease subunit PstC n=1 Tax=unclassified Seohaeicola TaxID=2641111 RepID=UPI00237AEFA5|nr:MULTISPECIES: phosphate ABC transporter permease subunit PstC [unclassified Seohaeicola]MDD9708750.1 phosphate ABC transporter permease subunit PstC [Seohaeicola sp. 4SK31]MDD9734959.1 phosphate ABC transporter permease subunit PstC [Seohaeicola sp. SP36]MDM7967983.1 phosphate ABC transporter permease subunit PstC [Paracoccaceae bacterium]
MPILLLIIVLGVLAIAGFVLGRRRALASVEGNTRRLHSLPNYYAWHGAIMAFLPAIAVLTLWLIAQPLIIERQLSGYFPTEQFENNSQRILLMADVRRVAEGLDVAVAAGALSETDAASLSADGSIRERLAGVGVALGADVTPQVLEASQAYRQLAANGGLWRSVLTLIVAVAGLLYALRITNGDFRARNRVEGVILGVLIMASTIAILTTIGIVLSMLSETIRFASMYPFKDFLFGLTWQPSFQGNSQLGLLPLLWGTLYISLVAMIVAVPTGLFTAIYLAEYASPRVRSIVKPLIEVIAGIPTVVFGLFALVTVGPFLRDWFAVPTGLGSSGSSVMTAGLVIGVLNIPFISSLADDIINAVPQSLRDGSYGLGATKSETVRQVILPAALPGIVGAILLAASRAIGETMIVTMGAGAAAKLDLNPFEAMTTITVKIVSQLTGDTEFNSPETLVAFALGMTLFVITLGLNIFALWVVRKYREQYE